MRVIRYIFLILLATLAVLNCSAQTELLIIDTPNQRTLTLELALTQESRSMGLMFRKELPEDHGMLFVFPDLAVRNFWMKNTYIPLSIAFLDVEGVVLQIFDMTPLSLQGVNSIVSAQYAIEVNQGAFEELAITRGTTLAIPRPLLARAE